MKFTTLHTQDTEYSADSVEWCAQDELHSKYFACGTYQLVESVNLCDAGGDITMHSESESTGDPPRKGRVYLYSFDKESGHLDRLQMVETAAILDMKWLPAWNCDSGPLLATVNALGVVEIYELVHAERQLKKLNSFALGYKTERTSALALSIDWQSSNDENAVRLLISDSLGNVHHLEYTAQNEMQELNTWHAHRFEAWTCAFDRWAPQRVYTGGDDCLLNTYDLRCGMDEPQRIWTNRSHSAGVTCLLSHPQNEHQLLTGSYDERLRVFDIRVMKHPLDTLNLNGGIWRLKSHPKRNSLLLVACMYTNFSVIDISASADPPDNALVLLGTYNEHSSICYGASWAPSIDKYSDSGDDTALSMYMATCSFYDHKLCVSKIESSLKN